MDEKQKVAEQQDHFAWLIEAPGPRYLSARRLTLDCDLVWSSDHNAAIRFHSEDQADATMMAIRALAPSLFGFEVTLGNARAIEHGWMVGSDKGADRFGKRLGMMLTDAARRINGPRS